MLHINCGRCTPIVVHIIIVVEKAVDSQSRPSENIHQITLKTFKHNQKDGNRIMRN